MTTHYSCGHKHNAKRFKEHLEKENYIEWKYSVGYSGDRTECYDCWRNKNGRIQIY